MITAWSTLVLAAASAIALIVAVFEIAENRRISKVKATLSAMADCEALETTFRYFDNGPDLKKCRGSCSTFFETSVRGKRGPDSSYFLERVYRLVDLSERIGALTDERVINLPLFLRLTGQGYNLLASYFILEPVLMELAKDELLLFEQYRKLAIKSQQAYKSHPNHNRVLANADFSARPQYREP